MGNAKHLKVVPLNNDARMKILQVDLNTSQTLLEAIDKLDKEGEKLKVFDHVVLTQPGKDENTLRVWVHSSKITGCAFATDGRNYQEFQNTLKHFREIEVTIMEPN